MSFTKSFGLRHVKTIGMIVAVHSFIYAIGYITGSGGFVDTILYGEVATIFSPVLFGFALLATSVTILAGYMMEHSLMINIASNVQSFIWLFATFVYFLNGDPLLALAIAGVWSVLSAYTAYAWRHRYFDSNVWMIQNYLDI